MRRIAGADSPSADVFLLVAQRANGPASSRNIMLRHARNSPIIVILARVFCRVRSTEFFHIPALAHGCTGRYRQGSLLKSSCD